MVPPLFSKLKYAALLFEQAGNRVTDNLTHKLMAFWKGLYNPYLYTILYRTPLDVDSVQNCVSAEKPRAFDHRGHLRAISAPSNVPALPKPPELIENGTTQFFLPSDTRPGLLEIPELSSPSQFEHLSKTAVAESRRLLSHPQTFSNPKRAVQVDLNIRASLSFCNYFFCNGTPLYHLCHRRWTSSVT